MNATRLLLATLLLISPLPAQDGDTGQPEDGSSGNTAPERPMVVGEVLARVPELPEVGQTFEVTITGETGGNLLAALTMQVTWNLDALTLESIVGGLRTGATKPFVSNTRRPDQVVISDINVPQAMGSGPIYNMEKQGRVLLYTLVFRRIGDGPPELAGTMSAFHDPGDGPRGQPLPIGGAAFPRTIQVEGQGVVALTPPSPQGEVWLIQPPVAPAAGDLVQVPIWMQLGHQTLGSFSLLLRHEPRQLHLVGGRRGDGEERLPVTSLGGQIWLSGAAEAHGPRDVRGRVLLCTLSFRRLSGVGDDRITGMVISMHAPLDESGTARPIGVLPLPRPIELR